MNYIALFLFVSGRYVGGEHRRADRLDAVRCVTEEVGGQISVQLID